MDDEIAAAMARVQALQKQQNLPPQPKQPALNNYMQEYPTPKNETSQSAMAAAHPSIAMMAARAAAAR